ncbi:MAG: ABC transporter permease [Pseudomonadota bacterium]
MRFADSSSIALTAIIRYPLRSSMLLLAIAIGVSAVLMLTSLGEGARTYVTKEFNSLGTNLLIITPGKIEVGGNASAASIGQAARPLTIEDAMAIENSPYIDSILPFIGGSLTINFEGRERNVNIVGTNHNMSEMFDYDMAEGRFLPVIALDKVSQVAVLGDTIASELFQNQNPLGKWLRIGDRRVRVIGVVDQMGQSGSVDVDETAFLPIAFAAQVFNTESVQKMMANPRSADVMEAARKDIIRTVMARHQGHDDITVLDQGAILNTFNSIFLVLTSTLGAIASISLIVAGTLIMNVMLVAVSQRTGEIGLIKALGGQRRQIITLFLTEAAILSFIGAVFGVVLGEGAIYLMREFYPAVEFRAPLWATFAAVAMAVLCGLLFGIMPARRAAALDPIEALASH